MSRYPVVDAVTDRIRIRSRPLREHYLKTMAAAREPARPNLSDSSRGLGRELFVAARAQASGVEQGATIFGSPAPPPPVAEPMAHAAAVL